MDYLVLHMGTTERFRSELYEGIAVQDSMHSFQAANTQIDVKANLFVPLDSNDGSVLASGATFLKRTSKRKSLQPSSSIRRSSWLHGSSSYATTRENDYRSV